jgi:hypothetical protein
VARRDAPDAAVIASVCSIAKGNSVNIISELYFIHQRVPDMVPGRDQLTAEFAQEHLTIRR